MNPNALVYSILISGVIIGCSSADNQPSASHSGGKTVSVAAGGQSASGGTSPSTSGSSATTGGASTNSTRGSSGAVNAGGTSSQWTSTGGAVNAGGASNQGTSTGGAVNAGGTSSQGTSTGGASSGCGMTGAATGLQNLQVVVAGQTRDFVLSVPTTYSANTKIPLIFAYHGLGGDGALARQYFGIERAANNQAIFVYPTGLPNADGDNIWTLTETGIDVQFFDTLLAEIKSKYCVDSSRVFSTGHSYGGLMTNALGCYRGSTLRAIAPVAGMPPFGNPKCQGPVAAWIAHGDNDPTVDYTTGGVATRDLYIKLNTCSSTDTPTPVDPSPCVAYSGCSDGHPVHWCVHQNGHNWPSFGGTGIWAFFNSFI